MSGIHTEIVESVHAYTRSDIPWEMASSEVMRAHGRDVQQMKTARRQHRFAIFAIVFAVVWTILYIV